MRPEPAEVWEIDGRPGRFVWRGRLYTVLGVTQRPPAEGSEGAANGHDDGMADWQCWRVSASPGKNVPATGFRLCQDPASGRWLLARDA
jgi:hypothetical protein